MKIDLHCHTKATKTGDSKNRNISAVDLKRIITSNGVKIIGITNHNEFDYQQYKQFIKEAKDEFQIWPGIELDVKGKKSIGHIIIINNPSHVVKFNSEMKKLIGSKSADKFICELDDILKIANRLDCLLIAHYWKSKSLDEESILYLKEKIRDKYRFFWEPSQYRSMSILINNNIHSLIGSDVKDWNNYSNYDLPNIKLSVDSFEQFVLLSKKDSQIVDTLYKKQIEYPINIGVNNDEEVTFYDDINVIFGTKGTGKTILLEKVKEYFTKKGKNISYYDPSENKDKIMDKLKVNENERLLSLYDITNKEEELSAIKDWKEKNVTQFSDYKNYILSKCGNANKDRMKLLDITEISGIKEELLNISRKKIEKVNRIIKLNEEIEVSKYITEADYTFLIKLYTSIKEKIEEEYKELWDDKFAINFSNKTIEIFKKVVEANTNLKTLPSSTGLKNYIKNRLKLECNIKKVLETFDNKFDVESRMLGLLEEGKQIFIEKTVKMYDSNCKSSLFNQKLTALKKIYGCFTKINEDVYSINIGEDVSELKDNLDDNNIKSLDSFLAISKSFKVDGKDYMPSTGEQTMIVLDEALNDNFDVYILDEPEKSLGNSYVNDVLVNQVIKLSKMKKTIVVATHNANLAVRTFPLRSILKEYSNGEYKTYVGNPFINTLVNIKNEKQIRNWKEESIKILEGGREAFEERGEIYGNN